jgi:hypothetical protein
MSSESQERYHNAGQVDASDGGRQSTWGASGEDSRAYKDGYYHGLGQREAHEGKNSAFSIYGCPLLDNEDDRLNLQAYKSGWEPARREDSGK